MATQQSNTNVVPIRQPRRVEVAWPEPPQKTPELATLIAVLQVLTPKQRERVKVALRRAHVGNPEDRALQSAHFYIGGVL